MSFEDFLGAAVVVGFFLEVSVRASSAGLGLLFFFFTVAVGLSASFKSS